LLSRCRTFVFKQIDKQEISDFIKKNIEKIYKKYPKIKISDKILETIAKVAN
jgi:DNA polymerase III gamma/tau subunit